MPNHRLAGQIATGTTLPETVMLERHERILRESFTRCRRDVSLPQRDAHLRNLIKRVENGRVHLAEHIVAIAWDAFTRGAPHHDVAEPFRSGLTMVMDWYGARDRGEHVPAPELLRRVIEAQTAAVNAEVAYLAMPCAKTSADATDAMKRVALEVERAIPVIDERYGGELLAA